MRNILTVALYESRTLFRSWFFRIFSILSLLIIFGINIGVFAEKSAEWTFRAIAANFPYINVLLMNVVQAVIAVFLASDFLRRDKKLDTTEVIYARPVTNGQYVVGKTVGILALFGGLVVISLVMSLIFNLVKQDTLISWETYLYYPLLIGLPTLVFILGLSFFLMILFRSQAVTFLLLLGYIALTLFYLQDKAYGLLDYMAFNLPMAYSAFIGFAEPGMILLHRITFLLLGTGFIFATIRFLNRLPQTGRWNLVNLLGFFLFLAAGIFTGSRYYLENKELETMRQECLERNNAYVSMKKVDILSNRVALEQTGKNLRITSEIRYRNQHRDALDTLVFSLNPGFRIDSITGRNGAVDYRRDGQVILMIPSEPLTPGGRGRITLSYHGIPVEYVALLDIPQEQLRELKRGFVATVDKKPGIVDDRFMLLTPDLLWYPVAGVGFNLQDFYNHETDFVSFSLEVKATGGLTAVAPGSVEVTGDTFTFKPENDLNLLSLVIGPFEKRSLEVEGVSYNLYIKPGHDYFSGFFGTISDTLGALIQEARNNYELDDLDLYLEWDRINLVEVPLQFHAYQRPYSTRTDYVLPGMILLPERGAGLVTLDFNRVSQRMKRQDRDGKEERSDREIETDLFKRFLQYNFFRNEARIRRRGFGEDSGEPIMNYRGITDYTTNPYCAFPLYYNYVTCISSGEYPQFNAMMEIYLKEGFEVSPRQGFTGGITDNERANMALLENSLTGIFASGNTSLSSSLINQTGSFIFSALKNRVGSYDFDNFLYYYLEDHAFREITFASFERDFRAEFDVGIIPYMEIISSTGNMASFLVSEPEYIQTRDDLGDVYLVRFSITNKGTARGIVDVTFRIMGQGGFGGGSGMTTEQRLYEVDAGITKEVQVVLYDQPRMMTVNTLISGNIPSSYNNFLRSADERTENELSEYERISLVPVSYTYQDEYVVDNEDPGFSVRAVSRESKLKQYIDSRKTKEEGTSYGRLERWMSPSSWHPVAHSAYYGETVRSAMVSRSGDGSNVASWTTLLPDPGFYDVYVYIPVAAMYRRPQGRPQGGSQGQGQGGGQGNRRMSPELEDKGTDYHYTLSSNEGTEEVEFVLNRPEEGWNRLGSFHFPADTVTMTLTNETTKGHRVIADAVKWVWRPD